MGTKSLMAAAGLMLLFAACEKEIPANVGDGRKVPVSFSVDARGYAAENEVVRSGGAREPVTTSIALNEDMYLQATLVPDSDEELRVVAAFKEDQKLCFAAFLTDGTQVGATAVYTYSGGKWTPVGDPLGVEPDNLTEYRFVAYSYFDETGTPPVNGAGIDPVHDLVYGMSANTKIQDTEAGRKVTISMTHKFARVRVRVRSTNISSSTISVFNGVRIEGGQQAALNLFAGTVSWSGSVTQNMGITVPSSPASNDIYGDYRTVKPVASPTKVWVGNVRVSTNSTTFSNNSLDFSTALNGGTSYTLLVELRPTNRWAKSNIYWDGNQLTFDRQPLGHENYQGVFFKWGSLVGISPVGDGDSAITIYVPGVGAQTISASTYGSWGAIPGGSSDICTSIDNAWRLPTQAEFGYNANWSFGGGSVTVNNPTGKGSISTGGTYNTSYGSVFFPSSGGRHRIEGLLGSNQCDYWTSTADRVMDMMISLGMDFIDYTGGYAFPVRCIRNN
jgi:hypothetical protein